MGENRSKKKRNRSKKKNSDAAPARTTPADPQTLKIWDTPNIDFQELSRFFRARRCRAGGETEEGGRVVERIVAELNRLSGILERASRIKSQIDPRDLEYHPDPPPPFFLHCLIMNSVLIEGSKADDDDKNNSTEEGSFSISYLYSPAFEGLTLHFASLPTTDDEDKNGGGGQRLDAFPLPPTIPTGMPEGPSGPVEILRPEQMKGWDFRGFPVRDTNLEQFATIENFYSNKKSNKKSYGDLNVFSRYPEESRPKIREYCGHVAGRRFEKITMPPPKELLTMGGMLTILPVSDLIPKENYEPHLLLVYNCAEAAVDTYNKRMGKKVKFSKVSAVFSDAAIGVTGQKLVIILSGVEKQESHLSGVDERESHFTYLTEVFLPHGYPFGCKVLRFLDLPPNQELDLKFGLYAAKERVSVSLDDPRHSKIIKNGAEFALDCYNKGVKDARLELVKVEDASFHLSWGDTYEFTFLCKPKADSEEDELNDAKYLKYLFPAVATVIHVEANDGGSAFKLVMFLRGLRKN
ncbi:hypothetical protein Tsubulata_049917 [Turnera subulata]|uniref:Uncharacterized protein n=1 Tax=Turnera subulata TaxID=218843 RepID=A0A9Q0FY89_9ROSI|nr:hypothetical protein Tsubulata_049917 [Turnera subulata]